MNIVDSSITGIREPGLGQDWIGRERFVVQGGGMVAFPLMPGDEVEVIDPEGLQCAHLFAFDSSGQHTTSALGISENADAAVLADMLRSKTPGAAGIAGKLSRFGVDLSDARAVEILGSSHE